MITIIICFAVLMAVLINEYDPGARWTSEEPEHSRTEYSVLKPTLKQLQNDVAELIQLKNKALAEQRNDLLNVSMPIIHAHVNTLAEIVCDTMAPAFVQKLVDTLAQEAEMWWKAQEKQELIDDNERRIKTLPACSYQKLEEAKQKGVNIL
ncbi:hypothetical protein HY485_03360 [Candidatus Woesearchaeota archaeon]|nr:hypothetical protein [Candidatus Woesearchaeota archaeon]